MSGHTRRQQRSSTIKFGIHLARAAGAALIFCAPLLMTMEMWWLGFYMDRARLALFLVLLLPLLFGLSHWSGIERTRGFLMNAADAFIAFAVAIVVSATVLTLLDILSFGMSWNEIVGKVTLQAIPASFGAMLARSQLALPDEDRQEEEETPGYWGELFLMAAGALFIAFNLAPTEEMVLIAYQMTPWHVLALMILSLAVMHSFIYSLEFAGGSGIPEHLPWWNVFLRFSVVGYIIALLISVYVLWSFGRLTDLSLEYVLTTTVVLGMPATIGAAAARLIL